MFYRAWSYLVARPRALAAIGVLVLVVAAGRVPISGPGRRLNRKCPPPRATSSPLGLGQRSGRAGVSARCANARW